MSTFPSIPFGAGGKVILLATAWLVAAPPAVTAAPVLLTDYTQHKSGEDWAPALARAFQDSASVTVPAGRYPCSHFKLPSGGTLRGSGPGTVFIPLGSRLFDIAGEAGKEIPIAEDIVDFSDSVILTSAGGLRPGDEIMIRGQRNSMLREGTAGTHYNPDWVLGRTRKSSCFFGELTVVATVAGRQITTTSKRLFPDYLKDNRREPEPPGTGFVQRQATTVSPLRLAKNVVLRDLAIEGTAQCSMPVRLSYCKDCLVENITFSTAVESFEKDGDAELSLVYGIYAWNTVIRGFKAQLGPELLAVLDAKEKSFANFSNYNLFKLISSTASGFENCQANGGTHAFNITRSASVAGGGGIPSVDCFVRDCQASNCIWAGVKVQQGCFNTEVTGNTVTASGQGIITCGRNTLIARNRVSTQAPLLSDFYYTHLERGGTFGIGLIEGYACGSVVRDNVVAGFHSGIAVADGYEDKNCFEEGGFLIERNHVSGCLRGFTIYKNPHCASLGNNHLALHLLDNTFLCAEPAVRPDLPAHGAHLPPMTAGVEICGNRFQGFRQGVAMAAEVDLIQLHDNQFEDCDTGIELAASERTKGAPGGARVQEGGNTFLRTAMPRRFPAAN